MSINWFAFYAHQSCLNWKLTWRSNALICVNGWYFLYVYFMLTRIHALYTFCDDVFVCCACQFKVNLTHTHTHTEKINKFTLCSLLSFQHMRFSHLLHLYVNAFSYFDFVLWRSNFWLIIMCVHTTQYKVIFVSIVANGCLAIFPVFSCSFPFYVAVCRRLHQLKCGLWPQINGTMLLLRACFIFFAPCIRLQLMWAPSIYTSISSIPFDSFILPAIFWYFWLIFSTSARSFEFDSWNKCDGKVITAEKIMCAVPSYQCQA